MKLYRLSKSYPFEIGALQNSSASDICEGSTFIINTKEVCQQKKKILLYQMIQEAESRINELAETVVFCKQELLNLTKKGV